MLSQACLNVIFEYTFYHRSCLSCQQSLSRQAIIGGDVAYLFYEDTSRIYVSKIVQC